MRDEKLDINNYSFGFIKKNRAQWQGIVTTPDKNRFSISFNSAVQPPNEWLFDLFVGKFKEFILEVDEIKENLPRTT